MFLEKCLSLLYRQQENDEQEKRHTIFLNGIGFNQPDSYRLSQCAELLKEEKHLYGKYLRDVRKRMIKYSLQLIKLGALDFINKCKDSMEELQEKNLI